MPADRSIRRKLILGMVLALALGVVVLALFYLSSMRVVRMILAEDTAQTASLVAGMLDREVAAKKVWVRDIAKVQVLEQSLADSSGGRADAFLRDRLGTQSFLGLWLMDQAGRVKAKALAPGVSPELPDLPPDREIAFPVRGGRLNLAVAAPVGEPGHALGRLVCLSRFPSQAVFGGVSSRGVLGLALWVRGRLAAASPWLTETDYSQVRASDGSGLIDLTLKKGRGSYLAVPLPMTVVAEKGGVRGEIVRDMRRAQLPFAWLVLLFVAAWVVMAIVFLAFGRFISVRLVDPVLALSREAERIRRLKAGGDEEEPDRSRQGESEIDRLYRSFNQMVQGLDRALERASGAEEKYRGIFVNAMEGLFQTTPSGRFLSVNPAMADIFGYESPRRMIELLKEGGREHFANQDDRIRLFNLVRAAGRVEGYELRLRRVDGTGIWISASVRAVRDVQGNVAMYEGSMVDVTEAKRAAKALKDAKERAEAALSELEAFSYSVSHDLRTPLRAVDGFSQALFEDYGHMLEQEGRDYIIRVRKAVQRIGELIDDLQNLVTVMRMEVNPDNVDVTAMARGILGELAGADPRRSVDVRIEPGLEARADPVLLDLVFRHLLHNSWKFTSRTEGARIEVGVTETGGERVFHVKDNGAGFDMAFVHKLFGPFGRLHSPQEYEGSGIGLAIVKRAVNRHTGHIWADAAPGRGASFYFTLE